MKKTMLLAVMIGTSALSTPAFARPMTENDLTTLKRLSAPAVSPDGKSVVYQLRETDLEANKGKTDLYIMSL